MCLPDHAFMASCASYRWQEQNSELLKRLNGSRREAIRWTTSAAELETLAGQTGFRVVSMTRYLSPLTLKIWDIGLRPVTGVLVKMLQHLREADRLAIKLEWMERVRPFLSELYELDRRDRGHGGFHFVGLEKA